jgi:hypothetical protein
MGRAIRNIQALNRSIQELRNKQATLESKMDENFQELKGNYFSMTLNSMFGSKKSQTNFWADTATRIMESEKLQHGVGSLISKLADKLGEAIHSKK